MMAYKAIRLLVGLLTVFVALTAIGGGIAMLAGADQFPLAWLEGTPFTNYTIPALLLAMVVGGSSLVTAWAIFTKRPYAALAGMAAGILMAGFITVEVLMLKQTPPGPTPIEIFYFVVGVIVFALAVYLGQKDETTARNPS